MPKQTTEQIINAAKEKLKPFLAHQCNEPTYNALQVAVNDILHGLISDARKIHVRMSDPVHPCAQWAADSIQTIGTAFTPETHNRLIAGVINSAISDAIAANVVAEPVPQMASDEEMLDLTATVEGIVQERDEWQTKYNALSVSYDQSQESLKFFQNLASTRQSKIQHQVDSINGLLGKITRLEIEGQTQRTRFNELEKLHITARREGELLSVMVPRLEHDLKQAKAESTRYQAHLLGAGAMLAPPIKDDFFYKESAAKINAYLMANRGVNPVSHDRRQEGTIGFLKEIVQAFEIQLGEVYNKLSATSIAREQAEMDLNTLRANTGTQMASVSSLYMTVKAEEFWELTRKNVERVDLKGEVRKLKEGKSLWMTAEEHDRLLKRSILTGQLTEEMDQLKATTVFVLREEFKRLQEADAELARIMAASPHNQVSLINYTHEGFEAMSTELSRSLVGFGHSPISRYLAKHITPLVDEIRSLRDILKQYNSTTFQRLTSNRNDLLEQIRVMESNGQSQIKEHARLTANLKEAANEQVEDLNLRLRIIGERDKLTVEVRQLKELLEVARCATATEINERKRVEALNTEVVNDRVVWANKLSDLLVEHDTLKAKYDVYRGLIPKYNNLLLWLSRAMTRVESGPVVTLTWLREDRRWNTFGNGDLFSSSMIGSNQLKAIGFDYYREPKV